MRLGVISDVHGHADELRALVKKIEAHQVDRLVLLGDLIDRGPKSFDCLDFARVATFRARSGRKVRVETIKGNHEDGYVRHYHGLPKPGQTGRYPVSDSRFARALRADEIAWMEALPSMIHEPRLNVTLVHGGILPSMRTLDDVDERALRVRFLSADGTAAGGLLAPKDGRHWSDVYDGRFGLVLYGHQSWSQTRVMTNSIGLDGEGYGTMRGAIVSNERSGVKVSRIFTARMESRWRSLEALASYKAPAKHHAPVPVPAGKTTKGWPYNDPKDTGFYGF